MRWNFFRQNDQASFAYIRKTIIFCFFLAAVFALFIILFLTTSFNQVQNGAAVINTAGKQRMLSQKIAKNIHKIQDTDLPKGQIARDAHVLDSVHQALKHQNIGTKLAPHSQKQLIDSIYGEVSVYQESLIHFSKRPNLGRLTPQQLQLLEYTESRFLEHMDDLVDIYQKEHETVIDTFNYLVVMCIIAFLIFLVGLYKLLFKPMTALIRKSLAEQQYKIVQRESILENTSDLIWAVDSAYCLVACNSAFVNQMKLEIGKTLKIGDNILDQDYEHLEVKRRKALYDRALNGESFEMEFEYTEDGQKVTQELSFHPIYDETEEISGCSVFRKNITNRVNTYRQLKKSEKYLREAQEIANIGNWNWDMFKNEISWSDQLYKVFGRNPKTFEATYEGLMEVIHPDDQANFGIHIESCLTKNEALDVVHRIVLPDNSIRYVHQKGKAHYEEDGTPMRMAGTIQDVTDLEKARLQNLKQFNELQNFVYIISHNVRAPISTLQSLVDIIEPGNDALNAQVLPTIGTTVETLDQTIRDLNEALSLKNIDEKMFQPVDLNTILKNIEHLISMDITSSNAKLEYHISDAPTAYGIPSYYTNILFNLILNAIKYKAEDRCPHIKVRSRSISDGLEIYVEDNGKGMELTKEKRKRIFDMYGRLSGKTEGRGMGLYLAKTQIEAMQGSIDVQSVLGEGTTFKLTFANHFSTNEVHPKGGTVVQLHP